MQTMQSQKLFLLIILGCSTMLYSACSGQLKLNSQWRDREVAVDGQQNEWQDQMTFVEKENVSIGVSNDSEFLYLSLVANNQDVRRQMMMRGFTVWFDADGGKDKTFGIRYPMGVFGNGVMAWPPPRNGDEAPPRDFEMALQEFELIGPGKDERQKFTLGGAKGIEMKIDNSEESLVYEIKIPLYQSEGFPYAIQAQPGKVIGVGFETAEFDRKALREKIGRSGGPSGIPPGGMGGRGRLGGGRFERPEPFKLWTTIELANEVANASQ